MKDLIHLYRKPLPAKRTGDLFNAFSYPTKISPEAIALYIACHTNIGDTILDPFAGSGTTGLAALLCERPTEEMLQTAKDLNINPKWGKRSVILYELSALGTFISTVMCNPPSSKGFLETAKEFLNECKSEVEDLYRTKDEKGDNGIIRHVIWSDYLKCPVCNKEFTFWEVAVKKNPLNISDEFNCGFCQHKAKISSLEKVTEEYHDIILNQKRERKKRVPVWIYGKTGKRTWNRRATEEDIRILQNIENKVKHYKNIPKYKLDWGILYRKGYHAGISHLHHFYTDRNLIVLAHLWEKINNAPSVYRDSLKLLVLSYNASHSTLMSRIVVKKNNSDFVLTGSQSGVLYISSLPVEKNILEGIKRKIKTFYNAFKAVEGCLGSVHIRQRSSTSLLEESNSVDYVFTDPPFGDYIPYSEINQINEAWLGKMTDNEEEAIINSSQKKTVNDYKLLMSKVFKELNRVLKSDGKISLVFHSARSEVWRSLISSYSEAGLVVKTSSILDKVQGSFKQVTSTIKVQGDPLLLLVRDTAINNRNQLEGIEENEIIKNIIIQAFSNSENLVEQKPERLYSRYVNACLESGIPVLRGVKEFNAIIRETHKV